jgi:hypothetical protein
MMLALCSLGGGMVMAFGAPATARQRDRTPTPARVFERSACGTVVDASGDGDGADLR